MWEQATRTKKSILDLVKRLKGAIVSNYMALFVVLICSS